MGWKQVRIYKQWWVYFCQCLFIYQAWLVRCLVPHTTKVLETVAEGQESKACIAGHLIEEVGREIWLLTQKQLPIRSDYEAENSQTLAFSGSLQSMFTCFLGRWHTSVTSISFPTTILFCSLPGSMTILNIIIIGIVIPLATVLRCNQMAVDENHWLKILDGINVISAGNWRARAGIRKGCLDHRLLGMKSIRFGEGEGEPARYSSCWEHTSAKIAVTKYGQLLRGVYSSANKGK